MNKHNRTLPEDESPDNGGTPVDGDAEAGPGKPTEVLADFTAVEPPPAAGIPDPESELHAYKSTVQVEVAAKRPVCVAALQIRKPNNQEFIRVLPGAEEILPLFRDKTQADKLYLFRPEVEPFLPAKAVRNYRLVLAKSLRAVVPFIWPLPVPLDDMGRTWHESADSAARDAETQWIKVVADMTGGCYVAYPAAAELPQPEWPAESLSELILTAFRNQRIDSKAHPVIRRSNGELV
jgi:hypothetical protein